MWRGVAKRRKREAERARKEGKELRRRSQKVRRAKSKNGREDHWCHMGLPDVRVASSLKSQFEDPAAGTSNSR